jgi:predicted nucleic acid-binding protein
VTAVAVDSSIAVAALLSSHPEHGRCREAAAGAAIPAHGLYETYSVLTRLPGALRTPQTVALDSLRRWFPAPSVLSLPAGEESDALSDLATAGVTGGAVYDGLIAWVARRHGIRLRSRDGRAARTYGKVGVDVDLM